MNLKRRFLVFGVVFLLVVGVLIVRSEKFNPSTDRSSLPVPSRDFDEWRKNWEKQR